MAKQEYKEKEIIGNLNLFQRLGIEKSLENKFLTL